MPSSKEQLKQFKWPITVRKKILAPAQSVWAAISSPGNLNDCHPYCEENSVADWSGVGSRDTIKYYSGWVLHREITHWTDGVGYDLTINRKGGRVSTVVWRITGEEDNSSHLSITLYPHALQNIPVVVRWLPHLLYIRPKMGSYLESVVKGFDWFITTGKPVTKNQFGTHPWFSD